ncbi:MAG TPA: AAA family ATPase, partial [Epsilonproteobacteria bacterium]|nr:AAA family ATPase [Campylobacterota bacterium]
MIDFTLFFQEQQRLIESIPYRYRRYLYEQIEWNERCLLITRQRGVGKTTMILQHLKEHYRDDTSALYISVDNPYFKNISLYEFAMEFEKFGGEVLYIDEIHKYHEWATHIKSLYDSSRLKLIISGSSMIQINKQQADLSRRVVSYRLANLSFREYLLFKNIAVFEACTFDEILSDHVAIASRIIGRIKPLAHFKTYLTEGCYPFMIEHEKSYTYHLIGIINQILEVDMPYATHIRYAQIDKIKKLIYLLSTSVPVKPNISKLAASVDVSRPTLVEYLHYLELGSLINTVNQKARGYGVLSKPDKLLMYNTNLMHAISHNADKGTRREAFFVNQIKSAAYNIPRLIDERILLAPEGD